MCNLVIGPGQHNVGCGGGWHPGGALMGLGRGYGHVQLVNELGFQVLAHRGYAAANLHVLLACCPDGALHRLAEPSRHTVSSRPTSRARHPARLLEGACGKVSFVALPATEGEGLFARLATDGAVAVEREGSLSVGTFCPTGTEASVNATICAPHLWTASMAELTPGVPNELRGMRECA